MSRHHSLITDPSCPDKGLFLWVSQAPRDAAKLASFGKALARTLAPGADPVRGDFVGQVVHSPDGKDELVFEVQAVAEPSGRGG